MSAPKLDVQFHARISKRADRMLAAWARKMGMKKSMLGRIMLYRALGILDDADRDVAP